MCCKILHSPFLIHRRVPSESDISRYIQACRVIAIYGIAIYWRYTHKRVPALVYTINCDLRSRCCWRCGMSWSLPLTGTQGTRSQSGRAGTAAGRPSTTRTSVPPLSLLSRSRSRSMLSKSNAESLNKFGLIGEADQKSAKSRKVYAYKYILEV